MPNCHRARSRASTDPPLHRTARATPRTRPDASFRAASLSGPRSRVLTRCHLDPARSCSSWARRGPRAWASSPRARGPGEGGGRPGRSGVPSRAAERRRRPTTSAPTGAVLLAGIAVLVRRKVQVRPALGKFICPEASEAENDARATSPGVGRSWRHPVCDTSPRGATTPFLAPDLVHRTSAARPTPRRQSLTGETAPGRRRQGA